MHVHVLTAACWQLDGLGPINYTTTPCFFKYSDTVELWVRPTPSLSS